MTFHDYQDLARRTQNPALSPRERLEHGLWGLTSEVGEICGIHQKKHQGHLVDTVLVGKELGDVMWFVAELCDVYGYSMGELAERNIAKLRKRYPDGFRTENSLHRAEGDV